MQDISSRVAQADWAKMRSIAQDSNNSTSLKVKLSDVVNLNLDIKRIHASVSPQFLEKHAATAQVAHRDNGRLAVESDEVALAIFAQLLLRL